MKPLFVPPCALYGLGPHLMGCAGSTPSSETTRKDAKDSGDAKSKADGKKASISRGGGPVPPPEVSAPPPIFLIIPGLTYFVVHRRPTIPSLRWRAATATRTRTSKCWTEKPG